MQFLDASNIQAFLDQPTQGFQDRYLAKLHNFVAFGDATGRAYLKSIDVRYALFRVVGIVIGLALIAGVVLVHVALSRGVIEPLGSRPPLRLHRAGQSERAHRGSRQQRNRASVRRPRRDADERREHGEDGARNVGLH